MPRKASHGWSMRQQGGYRQGGPVKKIFTSTQKSKDKKQINSEINQALSLQQAANIGALILSKCFNCGSVKEHKTKDILSKSTSSASEGLKEISKKAVCAKCGSKNIRLQYTLDGKFRKKIKRSKPNYEKNSNQPVVSLSQQAMRGNFRSPKEAEKSNKKTSVKIDHSQIPGAGLAKKPKKYAQKVAEPLGTREDYKRDRASWKRGGA